MSHFHGINISSYRNIIYFFFSFNVLFGTIVKPDITNSDLYTLVLIAVSLQKLLQYHIYGGIFSTLYKDSYHDRKICLGHNHVLSNCQNKPAQHYM